jgi:hypothetical protein
MIDSAIPMKKFLTISQFFCKDSANREQYKTKNDFFVVIVKALKVLKDANSEK